jgi:chromosomal replication initiator protein
MSPYTRHPSRKARIQHLREQIEFEFRVRLDCASRREDIAGMRHIGWYLIRRLTGASYPEIAMRCGDWHHTTVLHAVQKIERDMRKDAELWMQIEGLAEKFGKERAAA